MNLLIAGGTGFVGQALIKDLSTKHSISVLTRDTKKSYRIFPAITAIDWLSSDLKEIITKMDVVINLVGENIGSKRWSNSVKLEIISSRMKATSQLCNIIESINKENRPRLFNASAIGIYGLQSNIEMQQSHIYTEDSNLPSPPTDFLSEVGQEWESQLNKSKNIDIVKFRFAVILDHSGGMLKKVYLPFMLGLGGRIGSGKQPFSWIALKDVVGIISYLLDTPQLNGTFNLVAPQVVSQKEFAILFAKHLKRPAIMPMPSCLVKLLFGQMGDELLLRGQNVSSVKLTHYKFKCSTLKKAFNC